MRRGLGLLLLGFLALVVQSALAGELPPHWTPDLGLLVVVGIGLSWRSAVGGLLVVALLGFLADLFSGTLLGQHALLRVLAFGLAWTAGLRFNLVGALPQAAFVAVLSVLNALGLGATTAFFFPEAGVAGGTPPGLAIHATLNAVCAPLATLLVARLVQALGPDDGGRRVVRLETRGFSA